jgi:tRNA-Thr(GGU) m(6)t(6)A37 methyltransferase TsaA
MVSIEPIGIIHSPYKTKEETPIQGIFTPDAKGTVEIFAQFQEGLKDIESFSHLYLLYYFDRAGEVKLVRPMLLDDESHGVLASRHPARPSKIGLTVVRLLACQGNLLQVSGIDLLDQTPILDIKPYVPRFDAFPMANEGWLKGKGNRIKPSGRE